MKSVVMATSILALLSNVHLVVTIANSRVSHAHSFTLSSVSVSQMAVSLLSLVAAATPMDAGTSQLLRNTLEGLFASGCVGGSASVIWINWWSLVRVDNAHLPSSRRMSQVTVAVLWLTNCLSVIWLQLVATPDEADGQRSLRHCLRLYTFVLVAAAGWSFFCNVAYVPSVVLTSDAFRTGRKRNHDCNADCLCSESDLFSDGTHHQGANDHAAPIVIQQHDSVNQ